MSIELSEEEFEEEVRKEFLSEALDIIVDFETELLKMESSAPDKSGIDRLFRMAHTIKGSGYAVNLKHLGSFVHKVENVLSEVREGRCVLGDKMIDVFLRSVDVIKEMLSNTKRGKSDHVDCDMIIQELLEMMPPSELKENTNSNVSFGFFDEEEDDKAESVEKSTRVLIVDDDDEIRSFLCEAAENHDFSCEVARDGEEAVEKCSRQTYDVVITDLMMPNLDGLGFISKFREIDKTTPVLIITGYPSALDIHKMIQLQVFGYLKKPFETEDFVMKLNTCAKISSLKLGMNRLAELNYDVFLQTTKIIRDSENSQDLEKNKEQRQGLERRLDEIAALTAKALAL